MDILSDKPAQVHAGAKGPQIAGHIGCAARVGGFFFDLYNRHRSLRRDARNTPPDEFVEHHIAHDKELAR
jgi:hypothetical protein